MFKIKKKNFSADGLVKRRNTRVLIDFSFDDDERTFLLFFIIQQKNAGVVSQKKYYLGALSLYDIKRIFQIKKPVVKALEPISTYYYEQIDQVIFFERVEGLIVKNIVVEIKDQGSKVELMFRLKDQILSVFLDKEAENTASWLIETDQGEAEPESFDQDELIDGYLSHDEVDAIFS